MLDYRRISLAVRDLPPPPTRPSVSFRAPVIIILCRGRPTSQLIQYIKNTHTRARALARTHTHKLCLPSCLPPTTTWFLFCFFVLFCFFFFFKRVDRMPAAAVVFRRPKGSVRNFVLFRILRSFFYFYFFFHLLAGRTGRPRRAKEVFASRAVCCSRCRRSNAGHRRNFESINYAHL